MILLSGFVIVKANNMWVILKGREVIALAGEASDAVTWVKEQL